jgi:hypothetical protein
VSGSEQGARLLIRWSTVRFRHAPTFSSKFKHFRVTTDCGRTGGRGSGYGATDKLASGYDRPTSANDIQALMASIGIEGVAMVGNRNRC